MHYQCQKFEIVMRQLENLKPSLRLHQKEIEKRFAKITHTPNHPPYASMIQKAISELDEQGGSSEEAILTFIEAEYDDLPIPHTSLLRHHLQKLVTKGEIVCTSANCYTLSAEISDSVHKLKKGKKPLRKFRQGRPKGRQHNAKEARSQQKPRIEENQEHNLVCEAEKQKQAGDEVTETELQEDVITEEPHHREQKSEYIQIQDQESEAREEQVQCTDIQIDTAVEQINPQGQCQVLCRTVEGTAEEHNEKEESHQARKNNEVTEIELQEVREIVVTEEPHGEEQINPQGQCFEVSFEEKKLQEQQREVCCQIIDLSNMLVQFVNKERENEAPVSTQNDTTIQKEDLFGSSHLTKEEFMELLKKTNKIEGKLIDVISSKSMDMFERNNSEPSTEMQQKKLLEDHLQQTKKPSESLLVCDQLEVSESQPKTILASDNAPTGLMQFEQNCPIELPIHKRPPEVDITILEGLNRELNKPVKKLCDQQEAFKLQPKSMASSLDASSNSLHDKNENSQVVVERIEMVLEEIGASPMTESTINFIGEAGISRPETGTSFTDVQFMDSEKLQNSKHCGPEKIPESELVTCSVNLDMELPEEVELTTSNTYLNLDLQFPVVPNGPPEFTVQAEELSTDGQQTTFCDVAKRPEYKLGQEQPENLSEERPTEHGLTAVEQQMQGQKLVDQLPPLSQMPSKPQLTTTTTCITKQRGKTKKIPDQRQLRKLRPRGPRPSKQEPVVTTVEADKGPRLSKHEPFVTTVEADKSPRPSKYEPVVTNVEAANDHVTLSSLKAELKQNSESSNCKRPQGRGSLQIEVEISQSMEQEPSICKRKQNDSHKAVVKISQSTEQQGQRNQLKSQPTTVVTTVDSAISSQQQFEQVEPQSKRRGRPPKVKPDVDSWPKEKKGSLFSDNQNHEEPQQKRPRGRPPKSKLSSNRVGHP
ncbi:hypothetical protein Ddye_003116 [Dipteronia dyeriana]|uniref:H15 domain-containing protein n=1 Tax=Dipteronia dyeriana TaxID=168575 RepID=A0AAE0CV04_9ROSI|nr:hypothetical protein Ddye_003116 [Dipteronia dyeriana]